MDDPRPVPAPARRSAALDGARLLARLLDEAVEIPGTSWRVGIDPIVGLVPGIGDLVSAILSTWIILVGVRLGAPGSVVARMALNVGVDTLVGAIPIGGDLFDFARKSNVKNVRLIEAWLERPGPTHRASGALLAGILAALALLLAGILAALALLLAGVAFALFRLAAWAAGAVTA